jgi:hypothetical protein
MTILYWLLAFLLHQNLVNVISLRVIRTTYPLSGTLISMVARSKSGELLLETPSTIDIMMKDVATGILNLQRSNSTSTRIGFVDIPLPVTGGTELDDWPGGIQQKFSVLSALLKDGGTFKALNFSTSVVNKRNFMSEAEDGIGIWEDKGIVLTTFVTPEQVDEIVDRSEKMNNQELFVLINNQFFLDPLSRDISKNLLKNGENAYTLEQLNMKGYDGVLPVRGVLFRCYPDKFQVGRRLDEGGYVLIRQFEYKPSREELEMVFKEDSTERDKNLSFQQRLQKMIPQF